MPILTKPIIVFPLERMAVGDSFFVPSYNAKDTIKDVDSLARKLLISIKVKAGIENGLFGVRIWRVT